MTKHERFIYKLYAENICSDTKVLKIRFRLTTLKIKQNSTFRTTTSDRKYSVDPLILLLLVIRHLHWLWFEVCYTKKDINRNALGQRN